MSSLPKFSEGLTDIGAQIGELKFVISKIASERKVEDIPLTSQDRMRRAFVIQASLGFDAKEIKFLFKNRKERLSPHLKTMLDRNIPWIEDLRKALPGILVLIKDKDPVLFGDLEQASVLEVLNEELVLIKRMCDNMQDAINGIEASVHALQSCDRIIEISKSLFPLFSRAKDALGIKKAEGAI